MRRNPVTRPVLFSVRHPVAVVLIAVALIAACAVLAAKRLDVSTDLDSLFSSTLPWKQRDTELKRLLPQDNDLVVAVIEADTPEEADATAAGLAAALAHNPHFRSVRRPDASPFFDREGLLFLDQPVLEALLNQTIDAQPFLGQLAADPTARGLFAALALVGMGVERGQAELGGYTSAFKQFDATLKSVLAGHGLPLSWQRLLSGSVADMGGPYRFVLGQANLDYGALRPGGAATDALHDAASKLEFVRAGQARVRVTGLVALADEEFATAAQGAIAGLAGSSALVVVWLFFAVRTWRLVVPIMLTLVTGLLLTTGFATLTVNPLNLISVAFAILFVGIAVDFAIQFSVRYRDMTGLFPGEVEAALMATAGRSGGQIMIAAFATATGFLAFVPTDFSGVAELGLIAGVGMLIAFCCSVTVLPAAIELLAKPDAVLEGESGFAWAAPLDRLVWRARHWIVAAAVLVAALGIFEATRLQFDSDPLHTKDPNTEAMRTLADLAANPLTDPYTIDILTPNAAAARAAVTKVEHLPLVQQVLSLDSFVPEDQAPKLALIADAAGLLAPTLAPQPPPAPITPADIRQAAQMAGAQLSRALPKLPADSPLVGIAADLKALQTAPDATVMAADAALTRFLPDQLDRLRSALQAQPATEADVPDSIKRDWVLPDGQWRVQVAAKPEAKGPKGLHRFVAQVEAVEPNAGGSAVSIVATADTIIGAFKRAATGAVVGIMLILALALRRVADVLLVLAPLLLSGLMTALLTGLLSMQLNFANIIALPLLLGVGVSFNIYFVMNWRAQGGVTAPDGRGPLASPTARAVAFSALTTGTAFGSLALSHHPGTASMGTLLLLSLACTLLASLVFVPALLALFRPHRGANVSLPGDEPAG